MRHGLAAAILSSMLCACAAHHSVLLDPPPEEPAIVVDDPVCVSCGGLLEASELARLTSQAEGGDPNAAFHVWWHYVSAEDAAGRAHWLRRAAELGDPVAQYNLWFELRSSPNCAERLEALTWLKKSAVQGNVEAKSRLEAFPSEIVDCEPIASP